MPVAMEFAVPSWENRLTVSALMTPTSEQHSQEIYGIRLDRNRRGARQRGALLVFWSGRVAVWRDVSVGNAAGQHFRFVLDRLPLGTGRTGRAAAGWADRAAIFPLRALLR